MAVYKNMVELGRNSGVCFSKLRSSLFAAVESNATSMTYYGSLCSRSCVNRFDYRRISQLANGKLDTLALARSLEAQGVPWKQAEAITATITEVLNNNLENAAHSFVSKAEMHITEMVQESNLSKFKCEVRSSQDHHFEKLRNHTDKMHIELRYDFDKLAYSTRDELTKQTADFTNLSNKLDRELHRLRAQSEVVKFDMIKYCIVAVFCISFSGLYVIRTLL